MSETHSQIIVVDRRELNQQNQWNRKIIEWSFIYDQTLYVVELQITYLSSKRVVKVNQEIKHTASATFAYESNFTVCKEVSGSIRQNGVHYEFELFLNGASFTSLQETKSRYEPLKMATDLSFQKIAQNHITQKNSKEISIQKSTVNPTKLTLIEPQQKPKNCAIFSKQQSQIDTIKNTQKELMKILKANKQSTK